MSRRFIVSLFLIFSYSIAAGKGIFDGYITPDGFIDDSKIMEERAYTGPSFPKHIDDRDIVQSIHAEGDNKIVYTMKDSSTRVFERDPFVFNRDGSLNKNRPWVRTR